MIYYKGLECEVYPPDIFNRVLYSFQQFQALGLPLDKVLDIGAHNGSLSLLAAHHGARHVIAVDPVHIGPLKENIKRCGFEDIIEPIHAAVSTEEEVEMSWADDGGMQSFLYKPNDRGGRLVDRPNAKAKGASFIALLERFERIDYLKIDCEGAEFNFLTPTDETKEALKRVQYLDLEIHPLGTHMEWIYNTESELIHPEYREDGPGVMRAFIESCGFDVRSEDEGVLHGIRHTKGVRRA